MCRCERHERSEVVGAGSDGGVLTGPPRCNACKWKSGSLCATSIGAIRRRAPQMPNRTAFFTRAQRASRGLVSRPVSDALTTCRSATVYERNESDTLVRRRTEPIIPASSNRIPLVPTKHRGQTWCEGNPKGERKEKKKAKKRKRKKKVRQGAFEEEESIELERDA